MARSNRGTLYRVPGSNAIPRPFTTDVSDTRSLYVLSHTLFFFFFFFYFVPRFFPCPLTSTYPAGFNVHESFAIVRRKTTRARRHPEQPAREKSRSLFYTYYADFFRYFVTLLTSPRSRCRGDIWRRVARSMNERVEPRCTLSDGPSSRDRLSERRFPIPLVSPLNRVELPTTNA